MYIEEELLDYLDLKISAKRKDKSRNIKLIAYYYGFGESPWPTLEQVAKEFNVGTKERVRQIINTNFRDSLSIDAFPNTIRVAEIVKSYDFISSQEIIQQLIHEGLGDVTICLVGIFNLLQDLDICNDYDIYDCKLRRLSRSSLNSQASSYLIHQNIVSDLNVKIKKARTLPGLLGLACLDDLRSELGNSNDVSFSNVIDLISSSENYCYVEFEGQKWYCFEDRDNALINSCEKLFGVIESCEISILSEVLENSLKARTHKFKYPTKEVIEAFLRKSKSYTIDGSSIRFARETSELTGIENDAVEYLKKSGTSESISFKNHLLSKGHDSLIKKAIYNSVLVLVNREGGRGKLSFQLTPNSSVIYFSKNISDERYLQFQIRLQKLIDLGTDVSLESTRRREQGILQEWLFDKKTTEECAICGRTYSVKALVAAHKKKRANCTEQERVDPHIVMPLCVFGCDFIYENRLITIQNGKVCRGEISEENSFDNKSALELVGRNVADNWLVGDHNYFNLLKK